MAKRISRRQTNLRVIINAAMSVDGKIATAAGSSAISSAEDLKRVHRLRAWADAVVVGISTVLADDPRLTVRLVKGKNPARVIVDSAGRIPLDSKILRTASKIKTIVATTRRAAKDRIRQIKDGGATVLVLREAYPSTHARGKISDAVDLKELFLILKRMGLRRILVEGGGELNWSLLRTGLANELIVTVSPRVVGGRNAITLVEGDGFADISKAIDLKLKRITPKKSGEIVVHYIVRHRQKSKK